MSELQELCRTLGAIDQDILQIAQELYGRSQALRRAAQYAAATVPSGGGTPGPAAAPQVAATLDAAARSVAHAAQLLNQAAAQGQAFVARTVGASGGPGSSSTAWSGSMTAEMLSNQDKAALADFTDTGYEAMNQMLRGEIPLDPAVASRCVAVSRALAKLPNYEGIVIRGTTLSEAELARYTPGTYVYEHGFTSADKKTPFKGNVAFTIKSQTGKDVSAHSTWGPASSARENEVLFDRSTRFKVLAHVIDGGMHKIVMKEV